MANNPSSVHRAALFAGSVAMLGLLTACGGGGSGSASSPSTLPGTAAPATGGGTSDSPPASAPTSASSGASTSGGGTGGSTSGGTGGTGGTSTTAGASSRCHTSELRATVGRNDPGAGQENFPIVLTNASSRTCTVRGYPGAAFVDGSGKQLGPDPKRESGSTPTTVTLAPGRSAWAGLTFSNPEVSGAHPATPAALLVTPPDERDSLKVTWAGGQVPVSGNASSVFLTVFAPGTGA
ncbi:DUF4232 domain-containing protein [Streptomyces sp. NPDC005648]|uniref:DUF4232 domain-containing protein n=1 Tax=Streptomyces sp. NPDC005648 TaxID=3157044 RepID=UPI0033ABB4D1